MVDTIVHLGFEVRVEFTLRGRRAVWAQVTRREADQLELTRGQIVVRAPGDAQVFAGRAVDVDRPPGPSSASSQACGVARDRSSITSEARRLAMSAIVTSSSTARRLARTATHTAAAARGA